MITVENLVKKFDTNYAVNNINFDVKKGEIVGFLGPNGAGKTTTMRILTGFLHADSGDAAIGGISVAEDPLAIKKMIGYLPESAPLYTDFMVEEYLQYIAEARGISPDLIDAKINAITQRVGLEKVIKKNIDELSKGFRQRVGLAQTLIHDPEVLILDEPTSGLDPSQIREIRKLIRELGEEKTVILSTHIMQEVEAVCDRVLIISNGEIVANGTSNELRAQSRGNDLLNVGIRGERPRIEESLKKLTDLIQVTLLGEANGISRYSLESGKKMAENIFSWAVSEGFILTELTETEASLEDLFLQLTGES